jgi:hypothetical protein
MLTPDALTEREVRRLVDRGQLAAEMEHEVISTVLPVVTCMPWDFIRDRAKLSSLIMHMADDYDWWIPCSPKERIARRQRREERSRRMAEQKRREIYERFERESEAERRREREYREKWTSEAGLRELACPHDPANGDHRAQLELGILLARRGDDQASRFWLRWAATAGYHVDGRDPYDS